MTDDAVTVDLSVALFYLFNTSLCLLLYLINPVRLQENHLKGTDAGEPNIKNVSDVYKDLRNVPLRILLVQIFILLKCPDKLLLLRHRELSMYQSNSSAFLITQSLHICVSTKC